VLPNVTEHTFYFRAREASQETSRAGAFYCNAAFQRYAAVTNNDDHSIIQKVASEEWLLLES